jgi:hypothetical protein
MPRKNNNNHREREAVRQAPNPGSKPHPASSRPADDAPSDARPHSHVANSSGHQHHHRRKHSESSAGSDPQRQQQAGPIAAAAPDPAAARPALPETPPDALPAQRDTTRAMTRSGAENKLTSRFLRDSDDAVQARKVDATRELQPRPVTSRLYQHTSFPVRPAWTAAMSGAELEAAEQAMFSAWLDGVYAQASADRLSPFEHNLEVWRQLWRVFEKVLGQRRQRAD